VCVGGCSVSEAPEPSQGMANLGFWGEPKMTLLKMMKVRPSFGPYLWKTAVVTHHRRTLCVAGWGCPGGGQMAQHTFLCGLNEVAVSVNFSRVDTK